MTPQEHRDKLEARREYYRMNLSEERRRAREYAAARRQTETISQAKTRAAKHREAAARYRETHRLQLRINEWERRLKAKIQREREADEEEYQAFMAMEVTTSDDI